jgi:hypothetical protein
MKRYNKVKAPALDLDVSTTQMRSALLCDLESDEYVLSGNPYALYYRRVLSDKFLSKLSLPTDESRLEKLAFAKFLSVNQHISGFNTGILPGLEDIEVHLVLLRARNLMHFLLGSVSEDEIFSVCKNGKGSSIGVPFCDTSPERKFSYPISTTQRIIPLWHRYCLYDRSLYEAIRVLNSSTVCDEFNIVEGSRATTVPKTTDSRRMIAVEPTLNMFFQQGLMTVLTDRLRDTVGIDLSSAPDFHQRLAYLGSISNRYATIDFSSASDTVSIGLLRFLLPKSWYYWLDLLRCSTMEVDGESVHLNMISTMGNATTFPIETLVLWCIGTASAFTVENPTSWSLIPHWYYMKGTCWVFGDDCILRSEHTSLFMRAASHVGFLVNYEKSFWDECYFRESCGGDFYHGRNVRPMYIRSPANMRKSSLEPWLYTIMNHAIQKYISYFGHVNYVYDRELFRVLFSMLKSVTRFVKVVPDYFPDDAGLHISGDLARFRACYDFRISPISSNEHGELRFSYCRFIYRHVGRWDEQMRYAMSLRDLFHRGGSEISQTQKVEHTFPRRKVGGYVVAVARSSCWTLQQNTTV